jgi:DNA polymerase-3 subunit gamma/tau
MASFDKKYRPKTFRTFRGNEITTRLLKNHIEAIDNFPATIMFTGPSGCGKTTLARLVAKNLKVGKANVYELNIADSRKIDDARAILENLKYTPMHGSGKVIILNECHKANNEFQNAMLEKLEEPPANTYFILCTTNPEKLLATIKTRATRLAVARLDHEQMQDLIDYVLKRERVTLNTKVKRRLLTASEGTPRSALLMLNSLVTLDSTSEQIQFINDFNPVEDPRVKELCQALLNGESRAVTIAGELDLDPEDIRRMILGYMSKVILNPKAAGPAQDMAAHIIDNFFEPLWNVGKPGLVFSCYNIIVALND